MSMQFLREAVIKTQKRTGVNPALPNESFKRVLTEDKVYTDYVNNLCEGLTESDASVFKKLAGNTRIALMENSMFQLNPYEVMTFPLLRFAFPKTIAKEMVTWDVMDAPEVVKNFIVPTMKDAFGNKVTLPHYSSNPVQDYTMGPYVTGDITLGTGVYNVLAQVTYGGSPLNPTLAHVQKNFVITAVSDGTNTANVYIQPTVDGTFAADVLVNAVSDKIFGKIDYFTGDVSLSSFAGVVTEVTYKCNLSLEENKINPQVELEYQKIRIVAVDRTVSTTWSIQAEQDAKALMDLDLQKEIIDNLSKQLITSIDTEIVSELIAQNTLLNGANHTDTFNVRIPTGFAFGQKQWLDNMVVKLNKLSATIYNDIKFGEGNVIAMNPYDASYLESAEGFSWVGDITDGGEYGPKVAKIKGKWKILVSPIVPVGTAPMVFKPTNPAESIYFFGSYVPGVVSPYPLASKPSLSILSRYGKKLLRPAGIACLNIVDQAY